GYKPYEANVEIRPGKQLELSNVSLVPVHEVTAASRSTESVDDAPSSVTIIDRRELDAFGYPTVAEAVRGVRGFTLSNDGVYPSLGVRGLGQPNDYGNRILMLFDGHPINDNVSSTGPAGHDQRVDLHDVDRIEIVRGPGSLLYGTGAFSGVVNLVTRPTD